MKDLIRITVIIDHKEHGEAKATVSCPYEVGNEVGTSLRQAVRAAMIAAGWAVPTVMSEFPEE
jgi:hypothetical protein